jgi:hypothetical protein
MIEIEKLRKNYRDKSYLSLKFRVKLLLHLNNIKKLMKKSHTVHQNSKMTLTLLEAMEMKNKNSMIIQLFYRKKTEFDFI